MSPCQRLKLAVVLMSVCVSCVYLALCALEFVSQPVTRFGIALQCISHEKRVLECLRVKVRVGFAVQLCVCVCVCMCVCVWRGDKRESVESVYVC